jgi:hypothetical protein
MVKPIKPLDYTGVADGELVVTATHIQTNMTGNTNFANPLVDLAVGHRHVFGAHRRGAR